METDAELLQAGRAITDFASDLQGLTLVASVTRGQHITIRLPSGRIYVVLAPGAEKGYRYAFANSWQQVGDLLNA